MYGVILIYGVALIKASQVDKNQYLYSELIVKKIFLIVQL